MYVLYIYLFDPWWTAVSALKAPSAALLLLKSTAMLLAGDVVMPEKNLNLMLLSLVREVQLEEKTSRALHLVKVKQNLRCFFLPAHVFIIHKQ